MSQFLSVGSKASCSDLRACFTGAVQLFMDISDSPFGRACLGNLPGSAYLTNVLDLKRIKRNGPDYFTEFHESLYRFLTDNPSVYVLPHWVSGEILKEEVTVQRSKRISLREFEALFPDLEEDVRYVVTLER